MKRNVAVFVLFCFALPALGQPSPGKAVALSVLLPGLGHRYVNDGSWRGTASYLALVEASFWLGVVSSQWQRQQTIQSYRTYAVTHAGAQLDGKDRRFLVTLGTYVSSDAYREDHLRQRRWDQVGYVNDPAFQWHWRSEADMLTYRNLRGAADTWAQRRAVFIATLAANRVLAALSALRSARRYHNSTLTEVSLRLTGHSQMPVVQVALRL